VFAVALHAAFIQSNNSVLKHLSTVLHQFY